MIKLTRKEAITITANLNPTVMVELLTNLQEDGTFAGGFSNTAKKINEQIVKYTHQNESEIVGLVFPPVIKKDSLIEFLDNNIPEDTGESEELTQREKELVWQSELEEHNRMVQEQNNFHL